MLDRALILTADDFGLRPRYDEGILEAARAGALDAVSAMVLRPADPAAPAALAASGVSVGLHLELGGVEDLRARLERQLERFSELFGRAPAHLDGHHHCHASAPIAAELARTAAGLGLPVRSVSEDHRRLLRAAGVATPDRLVGRLSEREPLVPVELRGLIEEGGEAPPGVTEWMLHPGHPDPASGSSYDAGREHDLGLLLELAERDAVRSIRASHRLALASR